MRCDKSQLLLYAVTDRHWLQGRPLKEVVQESLDGGVTFLQLREKALDDSAFLTEAMELQALCREYHVPFIVNDNVEIAWAQTASTWGRATWRPEWYGRRSARIRFSGSLPKP